VDCGVKFDRLLFLGSQDREDENAGGLGSFGGARFVGCFSGVDSSLTSSENDTQAVDTQY
jgi:hypothetical protein